jgi:hypothetical protein
MSGEDEDLEILGPLGVLPLSPEFVCTLLFRLVGDFIELDVSGLSDTGVKKRLRSVRRLSCTLMDMIKYRPGYKQ